MCRCSLAECGKKPFETHHLALNGAAIHFAAHWTLPCKNRSLACRAPNNVQLLNHASSCPATQHVCASSLNVHALLRAHTFCELLSPSQRRVSWRSSVTRAGLFCQPLLGIIHLHTPTCDPPAHSGPPTAAVHACSMQHGPECSGVPGAPPVSFCGGAPHRHTRRARRASSSSASRRQARPPREREEPCGLPSRRPKGRRRQRSGNH